MAKQYRNLAERRAEGVAIDKFIESVSNGRFKVGHTLTAEDVLSLTTAAVRLERQRVAVAGKGGAPKGNQNAKKS